MSKPDILVEFFTEPKERKITGLLAIPRISKKGNLYLPEELKRGDGVTVPILWNHPEVDRPNNQILESDVLGYAVLKWDSTNEQLKYEGVLFNDPPPGNVKVSLGVKPSKSPDHVCGSTRCYEIPRGLNFTEMSMTYTPGIPETTLSVTESFECKQCGVKVENEYKCEACDKVFESKEMLDKHYAEAHPKTENDEVSACVQKKIAAHGGEPTEQELAIKYSECRKEMGLTESVKSPRKVTVNLV